MRGERPRLRDEIVLREVDEDIVVYDPVSDKIALLNQSAAVILSYCDGSHSVSDVVSKVAEVFAQPADRVDEDVRTTIEGLRAQGLLEE